MRYVLQDATGRTLATCDGTPGITRLPVIYGNVNGERVPFERQPGDAVVFRTDVTARERRSEQTSEDFTVTHVEFDNSTSLQHP